MRTLYLGVLEHTPQISCQLCSLPFFSPPPSPPSHLNAIYLDYCTVLFYFHKPFIIGYV